MHRAPAISYHFCQVTQDGPLARPGPRCCAWLQSNIPAAGSTTPAGVLQILVKE